jgi:hypothetical protein
MRVKSNGRSISPPPDLEDDAFAEFDTPRQLPESKRQ